MMKSPSKNETIYTRLVYKRKENVLEDINTCGKSSSDNANYKGSYNGRFVDCKKCRKYNNIGKMEKERNVWEEPCLHKSKQS